MSGTGEKRQLKQIKKHLHQMLKSLGEEDGSNMAIKIDQFEMLRRDYVTASQQYEKANMALPNTSQKKDRGILIYQISSNKRIMQENLKKMVGLNARAANKLKGKKQKDIDETTKNEMNYKNLTVFHLQKTFFKLTKTEHKDVRKKQNYPELQTLQELKMKAPLQPNFESEDEEDQLQEKQLLQAIKKIDNEIEEKMDSILHGIQMINYNAITISEGIDKVHRKILINVENLDKNLVQINQIQDLIDQASPNTSKPNCIMNVIIVVILAIIVYLVVRRLIPEEADNQDALPT